MTSLLDVIGSRRRAAALTALEVAERLDDGEGRSSVQLDLNQALGDLRNYSRVFDDLRQIADELGPYRRGGPHSLVRDLFNASSDKQAARRVVASRMSLDADSLETRDISGANAFGAVPDWLIRDAAPLATAAAPLVAFAAQPLPAAGTGSTPNLVRWTTAPAAVAQAGANAAIATPTIADGTAQLAIKTYAVRAAMSQQLLDQGREGIDAQLIPAMIAGVDAQIDADIINADGSAGTVTGIIATSNVTAKAYTDATPTLVEAWPVIESAVRTCEAARGVSGVSLVMHPRRLSWLRQRAVVESVPALEFGPATIPAAVVSVFGNVNILTDNNVPITLGVGTNEDVILVVRGTDSLDLFVGPPRVQTGHTTALGAFVNVWKYVAFSAARLPAALGVVSGTGLVAPSP